NNKENYFAGGRLFVDDETVEIYDLGSIDLKKTVITTFEIQQEDVSFFLGLETIIGIDTVYYGFEFKDGDILVHNGTVNFIGGTIVSSDWLNINLGRELYFVLTIGDSSKVTMQIFSEKEQRPEEGETLHPIFNISTSSKYKIIPINNDKGDLIVKAMEMGGTYPIDKEWLDESESHAIRGGGEIADYYLQATGRGSMKILSPTTTWLDRQFYVPEQTNSTKISFSYLSTAIHQQTYTFVIYKNSNEFLYIYIYSPPNNNSYEKITVGVRYGENIINQTSVYVPYYQWISVSIDFSTSLELTTLVSYNHETIELTGAIYNYLTKNNYYNIRFTKPAETSESSLYISAISIQNGGGFSSNFANGEFEGWQFSDSDNIEYSTEVVINPDSLTFYAEPLGGWCDITVLVDDGLFSRTTRLEVEDYETFRAYLLQLPDNVDATKIHKYTIIVDGILTFFSIGFEQSVMVNDWLIAKPLVNGEVENKSTQIGNTILDFEDGNYSYGSIVSVEDPFAQMGSIGKCTGYTSYNYNDLNLGSSWKGSLGFWYNYDASTSGAYVKLYLNVTGEYEEEPINGAVGVYIYFKEKTSEEEGLVFVSSTYETDQALGEQIYNLYIENNKWSFVYLDLETFVAYACNATQSYQTASIYSLNGFVYISFLGYSGTPLYIDDFTIYEPEVEIPGLFARANGIASGTNEEALWVSQTVSASGYIDLSTVYIDDSFPVEQLSFVLNCETDADAVIHISTTHPFMFYQGLVKLYDKSTITVGELDELYLDVHLYEGINRFIIRSFSKGSLDYPWLLKADVLAPTSIEISSSEFQALNSYDEDWYIDNWLLSDRPIYWESVDFLDNEDWWAEGIDPGELEQDVPPEGWWYGNPSVDELEEALYNLKHHELTVMLPYAGEQFNFTVPTDYGVNVT
ncbi:MAG: hypothetical protein KAU62_09200, partial [Candidatus Heimdallarchaeota archaeon]|nr:hypothetical protein [Candidatus Heimdallarchaeota archaeon]MCK4611316.1 hypothetical protein [Candidatus Heimdallarchaeota archaeon]